MNNKLVDKKEEDRRTGIALGEIIFRLDNNDGITIIRIPCVAYERIGDVCAFKLFGFYLYRRVGVVKAFFGDTFIFGNNQEKRSWKIKKHLQRLRIR